MRPLDAGHAKSHHNHHNHHHHDVETDLLAGLWETAPFARLPCDAPPELKDLVVNIENPKSVYAIHRASRRHGFQQLVEKFIVQLRDGCASNYCTTPTCFSFRKRSVGRIPIRRYNVTSARVLAVYMASQDNPENALCPALRAPKLPPAAIDSLIFYRKPGLQAADDRVRLPGKGHHQNSAEGSPKGCQVRVKAKVHLRPASAGASVERDSSRTPHAPEEPKFDVTERHTGKDYRSFAANMFGTVAFKMLEWLTPNALEDMHETACDLQKDIPSEDEGKPSRLRRRKSSLSPKSAQRKSTATPAQPRSGPGGYSIPEEPSCATRQGDDFDAPGSNDRIDAAPLHGHQTLPEHMPGSLRRNSNASVRTNSVAQPKRQLSMDAYPVDPLADEAVNGLRSPRISGMQADKTTRSIKSTASGLTRPISQISSANYFDESRSDKELSPQPPQDRNELERDRHDDPVEPEEMTTGVKDARRTPSEISTSDVSAEMADSDSEMTYDSFLPQAISALNLDVVDFLCDVLQDDGTREQSLLEPPDVPKSMAGPSRRRSKLKRRSKSRKNAYPSAMKLEWKLFVEQSLFYTLSDPHALIRSFTRKGELIDSQTMWYCMLRMTRVAPTLVFHCLWLSAAYLFAPPKSVQSLRSPTARLFPKQELALSNTEAGRLLSICFHALIAALPVVSEKSTIMEMSRLRSQGLSMAGRGGQSAELCLQYDDAFDHDLATRLARRLLAALTTRRYYDDMLDQELAFGDSMGEPDTLAPLFAQLDALSENIDESLHETRMSTLLLDWARAIMFQEWDGSPEVPGDGSFGGALALMDAICEFHESFPLWRSDLVNLTLLQIRRAKRYGLRTSSFSAITLLTASTTSTCLLHGYLSHLPDKRFTSWTTLTFSTPTPSYPISALSTSRG